MAAAMAAAATMPRHGLSVADARWWLRGAAYRALRIMLTARRLPLLPWQRPGRRRRKRASGRSRHFSVKLQEADGWWGTHPSLCIALAAVRFPKSRRGCVWVLGGQTV